jgi:hypothetical protein
MTKKFAAWLPEVRDISTWRAPKNKEIFCDGCGRRLHSRSSDRRARHRYLIRVGYAGQHLIRDLCVSCLAGMSMRDVVELIGRQMKLDVEAFIERPPVYDQASNKKRKAMGNPRVGMVKPGMAVTYPDGSRGKVLSVTSSTRGGKIAQQRRKRK